VVGVIQCSKRDESYLIRWDNCLESLDALGLEPEKNAVCQFLEAVKSYSKLVLDSVKQGMTDKSYNRYP